MLAHVLLVYPAIQIGVHVTLSDKSWKYARHVGSVIYSVMKMFRFNKYK